MFQVIQGDCREVMQTMAENSIDAIVCDPPYDLTANKKGGSGPASENLNSPYGRARITTGFMGKSWDGTGIAFDPATWVEALRVLKPGGHLLAFGGTRTYHRMVCAIEDAGFEIRDQIQWLYGSGFPKSLDVSKAIDAAAGMEREVISENRTGWSGTLGSGKTFGGVGEDVRTITVAASDAAKQWDGWGTALKPAHEPIVVARKPLEGTVAANVLKYGTGGLNIGGCRIEGVDGDGHWSGDDGSDQTSRPGYEGGFTRGGSKGNGRWPANCIHDGSDEVLAAFPNAPGQQGDLTGHSRDRISKGIYGDFPAARDAIARLDSGSAARFFYCAKASQEDRDEGLEDLARRQRDDSRKEGNPGGDNPRNRGLAPRANHHPTVKPTDLMRYLCRLVTPPNGTVLDPFTGSGSTGKAAILEGLNFIGIEQDEDYCQIARLRIVAAEQQGRLF